MQILNIAGYKFISLQELSCLKKTFIEFCDSLSLKGTILLSKEGINIMLAGKRGDILSFKSYLKNTEPFTDINFRENYSDFLPFKQLKVKIKKEIITLKKDRINPIKQRAQPISPHELKQWLDEKRDVVLLDTRNVYEIELGTFEQAINLNLKHFSEFPAAIKNLAKEKPIVMFCTGGIRCEKAALYMLENGYNQVYQLNGGILNYFSEVGGAHYQGKCFVFDERIAVDVPINGIKDIAEEIF